MNRNNLQFHKFSTESRFVQNSQKTTCPINCPLIWFHSGFFLPHFYRHCFGLTKFTQKKSSIFDWAIITKHLANWNLQLLCTHRSRCRLYICVYRGRIFIKQTISSGMLNRLLMTWRHKNSIFECDTPLSFVCCTRAYVFRSKVIAFSACTT